MESLTLSLILLFIVIAVAPLISRRIGLPVIIVEMLIGIILGDSMLRLIPHSSDPGFLPGVRPHLPNVPRRIGDGFEWIEAKRL